MESLTELEELDRAILAAVPGEEPRLAEWMQQRHQAIEQLSRFNPQPYEIEEVKARTNQLEQKFLHWRRSSIMELSLIEQHMRYLNEQHSAVSPEAPTHVDIRC